jgi:Outer membrane protein beta-barrel domain
MRNRQHRSILKFLFLLGILLATAQFAPAQAMVSAERGAEIAPFAQTTLVSPDWGPTRNLGYTVGVDYTRFIRSIVQPALEFRMTSANGTTVGERTYSGGLKLQATIHRVHPYATLLAGYGTIAFNYPNGNYLGDNATVYTYGVGADFNVTSQWKLRADFTQQHWNLEQATLTPTTLGVGIAYTIPFHNGQVH